MKKMMMMTSMKTLVNRVHQRTAEVQDQLAILGFPKLQLKVDIMSLRPGVAGSANCNDKRISISVDYLKEHTEAILAQTLVHEICHHYVFHYFPRAKQYHGPEFRRLMSDLGADGSTHHSMQLVNGPKRKTKTVKRYVYFTENSKKEVFLTIHQHNKQQLERKVTGHGRYLLEGEQLQFSGEMKLIK
jgi:predicted SprT family Zn-dependent metalloprotease